MLLIVGPTVNPASDLRYIPNPAGFMCIDERSAPSEVKAPPIATLRAVDRLLSKVDSWCSLSMPKFENPGTMPKATSFVVCCACAATHVIMSAAAMITVFFMSVVWFLSAYLPRDEPPLLDDELLLRDDEPPLLREDEEDEEDEDDDE